SWTTLFPKITRDLQINYLCLNVALIALPEAFWTAITPNATLRHWQMIELGTGTSLTNSPLRINERILHYLWGIQQVDQRLLGMLEPLPTINKLAPSHQKIADEIAAVWLSSINHNFPIIQLSGQEIVVKTAITHVACTQIGINLQVISVEALLEDITQLNLFQRLWEREAMLNNSVLLLNCNSLENVDANIESKISRFIETIDCRLIVSSRERRRSRQRSQIIFDIEPATTNEQRLIWQHTLSKHQLNLNSHIDVLVSHFNLNYSVIESVCLQAKSLVNKTEENLNLSTSTINNPLWNICRQQARLNLDDLAQRVNSVADWDNLI
ncbi:MAG: ATP-binding protein, partial [Aphanizomenon sp.]